VTALAKAYGVSESQVSSTFIGPSWGADISKKALEGLIAFLILVSLVIAFYFRTWTMAVAGIVALLHDLLINAGVYALVGFEVSPASVIGFLTILGYSLYDTVVVFDKVPGEHPEPHGHGEIHLLRGGQPRGQPDPGPVDQHLGRGPAADRLDPGDRHHPGGRRHPGRPGAGALPSASRPAPTPPSSLRRHSWPTCASASRR